MQRFRRRVMVLGALVVVSGSSLLSVRALGFQGPVGHLANAVAGAGEQAELTAHVRQAAPTETVPQTPAATPALGTVTVSVQADKRVVGQPVTVNKDLLGVDGPGPTGATRAIRALGMRWVRTDVFFQNSYDCATGDWNAASLDRRVDQIRAEGAAPLLIVDYTPPCLAPVSEVPPPGNITYEPPDVGTQPDGRSDKSIWDGLVTEMARHEIARGVRAFEIWNEPDAWSWYGSLAGYLTLYETTAHALERGAAEAGCSASSRCRIEIGGPALAVPDASWIEPFLAFVAAHHLPLAFLSWHWRGDYPLVGPDGSPIPYPPAGVPPFWYNPALHARLFGAQVRAVRAMVEQFPSLHPLLWIDEWNVTVGYDPRKNGPYDAAFAAAVLDSVQRAGLNRMAFFDVADTKVSLASSNSGLLFQDLQPKPVYWTFAFWHDLEPDVVPVTLSPNQATAEPVGRIGALASSSGLGGPLTVLVYNFVPYDPTGNYGTSDPNPYDHEVRVQLAGLAQSRYRWARSVVDAVSAGGVVARGVVSAAHASFSFVLPGESVALLTLTPLH